MGIGAIAESNSRYAPGLCLAQCTKKTNMRASKHDRSNSPGNGSPASGTASTVTARPAGNAESPCAAKQKYSLRDHSSNLASFLTEDPKGKVLPAYLETLADHLAAEQSEILLEMDNLNRNL